MKSGAPNWKTIADAARQAPPRDESFSRDWAASVAGRAMRGAALGKPAVSVVALAWLARFKWLAAILVVATVSGVVAVPRLRMETTEVRCDRWAAETLRQLKAWYPLSCEDAGELGLLMRDRLVQVKVAKTNLTVVHELIDRTQQDIAAKLKPEEREQFAASQSRLRQRLQLGSSPPP